MKKKKLLKLLRTMLLSVVILMCCSCDNNNNNNEDIGGVTEKIQTVRDNLEKDYSEAKSGKFSNLEFEDFDIVMTEKNEIYNIKKDRSRPDLKGEELANHIKELYNVADKFLKNYEKESLHLVFDEPSIYLRYSEELYNKVKEGKYDNSKFSCIFYEPKHTKDNKLLEIHNGYRLIWLGQCEIDDSFLPISSNSEIPISYYKYSKTNNLADKYKLSDNEISIKDAIDYTENFLNNESDYPVSDIVSKEVQYAIPVKLKDNSYEIYFIIRNNYDGIVFDTALEGGYAAQGGTNCLTDFETFGATLIKKDKIDFYYGAIDNPVITKEEKITEIVPLNDAISTLSNEIGTMSSYKVCSIELAYRGKYKDEVSMSVSNNRPVWKFVCKNNTDKRETRFYVDAVTREIESDVY